MRFNSKTLLYQFSSSCLTPNSIFVLASPEWRTGAKCRNIWQLKGLFPGGSEFIFMINAFCLWQDTQQTLSLISKLNWNCGCKSAPGILEKAVNLLLEFQKIFWEANFLIYIFFTWFWFPPLYFHFVLFLERTSVSQALLFYWSSFPHLLNIIPLSVIIWTWSLSLPASPNSHSTLWLCYSEAYLICEN